MLVLFLCVKTRFRLHETIDKLFNFEYSVKCEIQELDKDLDQTKIDYMYYEG
jgi:hypothetical protein